MMVIAAGSTAGQCGERGIEVELRIKPSTRGG